MSRPIAWDGSKIGEKIEAADGLIWKVDSVDEEKKLMFISPHGMTDSAKKRGMKKHMKWDGTSKVGDTLEAADGVTWYVTEVNADGQKMIIETKWDKLKTKDEKPKKSPKEEPIKPEEEPKKEPKKETLAPKKEKVPKAKFFEKKDAPKKTELKKKVAKKRGK